MYTINITGNPFPFIGSPLNYITDSSYPATTNFSEEITGLEEFNEYTIMIAAVTSQGIGPYSMPERQRTLEDGMVIWMCPYFKVYYGGLSTRVLSLNITKCNALSLIIQTDILYLTHTSQFVSSPHCKLNSHLRDPCILAPAGNIVIT